MRLAHIADTHLGYRRWHYAKDGRNVRELDVYRVFDEAVDRIIELEVDAVVHAGDLFDSYYPSTQALSVALDALARLRDAGIPVVVIAGNHSTPRHHGAAHVFGLLERFGVKAIWREPEVVRIGGLAISAIPHHPDSDVLRARIQAATPDPGADANVIVMHVGVEPLPGAGSGEVAAVELGPEALEYCQGFDYVALGHNHPHAQPSPSSCYPGSLERLTFADDAEQKGFVLLDPEQTYATGRVELVPVHARPMHDLPPIDASEHEDLLAPIERALAGLHLEGAMVRCRIVHVEQRVWRTLDRKRLAELTAGCLHLELVPEFGGSEMPPVGAPTDLRSFIAAQVPEGVEPEPIVARAEGYLSRAAQEVQDKEAPAG
jgi:exonuclease SbcD